MIENPGSTVEIYIWNWDVNYIYGNEKKTSEYNYLYLLKLYVKTYLAAKD